MSQKEEATKSVVTSGKSKYYKLTISETETYALTKKLDYSLRDHHRRLEIRSLTIPNAQWQPPQSMFGTIC